MTKIFVKEKSDEYKLLQSFFSLSCLLFNEVSDGFVVFSADTPHVVEPFTDYILQIFVNVNSSFPSYLWTKSQS